MLNPNQLPSQITSSPLFKRAQEMAYGKSPEAIQDIARNLCSQRGVSLDEALSQFKRMFGV